MSAREQHASLTKEAPSPFPVWSLVGVCLGFLITLSAAQFFPYDPTTELPDVASLPVVSTALESIAEVKPADEFRIFTVGASLTSGYPYAPIWEASYGTLLAPGLNAATSTQRFKSRPIAKPALDSSKLVEIVKQLFRYQPDLLLVTLGSNEYANRLFSSKRIAPDSVVEYVGERGGRLRLLYQSLPMHGMRWPTRANDSSPEEELRKQLLSKVYDARPRRGVLGGFPFTDVERAELRKRLRRSMREISELGKAHDVPVVFCVAVYGLSGFWPWGPSSGGDEDAIDTLIWDFRSGKAGLSTLRTRVEALISEEPDRADLHFLKAELLRREGQPALARKSFERARDLDTVPIHQTHRILEDIRNEAAALGRPVLELDAAFRELSPDGIEGSEFYLDYGHLSELGHLALAKWLAKELESLRLLPALPDAWQASFEAAGRRFLDEKLDPVGRTTAAARMASANGTFSMLFGNFREAIPYLARAFETLPEDQDLAIRLIACITLLAGREGEFKTEKAATDHAAALWGRLKAARASGTLNELIEELRQAK